MVVLIVGIGLGGYIAHKFLGGRLGHTLAGVLGGLVSSTATTATYSRRVAGQRSEASVQSSSLVIVTASAVAFVRILIEIAVVAPGLLRAAVPAIGFVLLPLAGFTLWAWSRAREDAEHKPAPGNPSALTTALAFGLLYAVVLVATAAAKDDFGVRGTAVVAALSGLTDVDAMTLSSAQLFRLGHLSAEAATRLVVIAATSNVIFKGLLAAALGGRRLGLSLLTPFGAAILGAVLAFLLGYL